MESVLMMICRQILVEFHCCPLTPNSCMKCQAQSHRSGPFTQTPPIYISDFHCSQFSCFRTSAVLIFHLSFRNIDSIDCLLACVLVTSSLSVITRIFFFTCGGNCTYFSRTNALHKEIELKNEIITVTTNGEI